MSKTTLKYPSTIYAVRALCVVLGLLYCGEADAESGRARVELAWSSPRKHCLRMSTARSVTDLHSFAKPSQYTAVAIVPTGIGAAVGGYAGDSLPAARLLASVVDTLITHPNVMNGASMYWPMDNTLYVEGYALDEFAAGKLGLKPIRNGANRIGEYVRYCGLGSDCLDRLAP
jgi:hypothetical protein